MSDASGGQPERVPWWHWLVLLITILLSPLLLVVFLLVAIVSVPVEFYYRLRQQRQEKKLRPRLAAVGRFLRWEEVEAKLKAGEGTLLIEHCSPKGPIREWWTEDNLIAAAPVPLLASLKSPPPEEQLQALQEYARNCAAKYTDLGSGMAKLTQVPVPLSRRMDPRKYVVVDLGGGLLTAIILPTGRKLAEQYPQGRVVTLITWFDEPLLALGDAESVFLSPG